MGNSVNSFDHPIFLESIRFIRERLGLTGLDPLEQEVLERLIHSSGDFDLVPLLRFQPGACQAGVTALKAGAVILTDTRMASAAVVPMANRTLKTPVRNVLEWMGEDVPFGFTRTAEGMKMAWTELTNDCITNPAPIVLVGSSPSALQALLDLVYKGAVAPSLIIGMPVGFVGVMESKKRLATSGLNYILLNGSRGGAGLVSAVINALLRYTYLYD